jgi:hypothetical protein
MYFKNFDTDILESWVTAKRSTSNACLLIRRY